MKNIWLKSKALLGLTAVLALSACSKEQGSAKMDADVAQHSVSTVNFTLGGLSASVDEDLPRSISLALGRNKQNQLVPIRKKFTNGQKVPVHVAIRNESGTAYGAKTIEWTYSDADQQLKLHQGDAGNDIEVKGTFSAQDKWFVAGVIGGNLTEVQRSATDQTKDPIVHVKGERVLRTSQVVAGTDLAHLKVPYAFPWTVLTMETHKEKDTNGLEKFAHGGELSAQNVLTPVTFKPQGFIIATKLGNNLADRLKMEGFSIQTDAFTDEVFFQFNPAGTIKAGDALTVSAKDERCPMEFSFLDQANQSSTLFLEAKRKDDKTCYIWAYPTEKGKTASAIRSKISFYAENQTNPDKDYSNTYLTDYEYTADKQKRTLADARVYTLRVNATTHVRLPLEYMADYDLAGGRDNGFSFAIDRSVTSSSRGPLRFANRMEDGSARTDGRVEGAAYYHYYATDLPGMNTDATYNPQGLSIATENVIDTDGSRIPFSSKYRIPDHDDLWGVLPRYGGANDLNIYVDPKTGNTINMGATIFFNSAFAPGYPTIPILEEIKIGEGITAQTSLMQYYVAIWNKPRRVPGRQVTITAIRLQKQEDGCELGNLSRLFTGEPQHLYTAALTNHLRSAYRYVMKFENGVGGTSAGEPILTIEMVHLGDDATTAADIDQDAWWTQKETEGKVIKRIFHKGPWGNVSGQEINYATDWITHWARNMYNNDGVRTRFHYTNDGPHQTQPRAATATLQGANLMNRHASLLVRPFLKNDQVK